MFWLHLGSKSTKFSEYICQLQIVLSSTVVDLIRHAVKVSRYLILLFTLSLSELFSSAKGPSEAVILSISNMHNREKQRDYELTVGV
jgi:hypothetical protein